MIEEPDERLVIAKQLLRVRRACSRIGPRAELQVADDEDLLDTGQLISEVSSGQSRWGQRMIIPTFRSP